MCGIAGHVGPNTPSDAKISRCLRLMSQRGPDNQQARNYPFGTEARATLLHSRLSIIDPDPRGTQPMSVGAHHLTYNGELYNYRELRAQVAQGGPALETQTDTEVLLRLLASSGWESLTHCEGMWAFAHLNTSEGTLALARDRFGEKPLYVHQSGPDLYFGSEPKFIFALLGQTLPINRRQIARYLANGYRALYKHGETFFEGLEEIEPGTVRIRHTDGRNERHYYWRPSYQQNPDMTAAEAADGVRDALTRSVELRLRSDAPLAFCMSGGIDSNCLIGLAKHVCGFDVHGFTVMNQDARYEESEQVYEMVRRGGLRHTEVSVGHENFVENLRELITYHDAPIYTISYYLHWRMMQRMNEQGYRVSISGTAADELFTGYYDHHNLFLATAPSESARTDWEQHVKPYVRNPYLQDPDLFNDSPNFREHLYLGREQFAGMIREDEPEAFSEDVYTDDLLRNRMLNELYREVVPVILHEDDSNAMYCSIENRSPFLDRDLAEFAFTIPTKHLVRNGYNKVVLRDAMRGIVPDSILWNRRKVGFNAPISDLLNLETKAVRDWLLADSPLYEILQHDELAKLLKQTTIPNSQSKFLFSVCCAKLFMEGTT